VRQTSTDILDGRQELVVFVCALWLVLDAFGQTIDAKSKRKMYNLLEQAGEPQFVKNKINGSIPSNDYTSPAQKVTTKTEKTQVYDVADAESYDKS
jgi:hypothetical protein